MFEIARTHPEYGYRRTNAELRERGFHVNRKVVERLHSFWDLAVINPQKYKHGVRTSDIDYNINHSKLSFYSDFLSAGKVL